MVCYFICVPSGFLSPNMLNMNTTNFMINSQAGGTTTLNTLSGSPCPSGPVSPNHWVAQTQNTGQSAHEYIIIILSF